MNTANSSMTVLITGGTGFVMSNVVKHLLQTDAEATAILLDLAPSVIEQRPLRLTAETLEAGADFISAEDIGYALPALLRAGAHQHDVYNVAYGQFTPVPEVLDAFKSVVSDFEYELVEPDRADVIRDPTRRLARWNAYSIERISSEFGWTPRSLAKQLASYFEWVMAEPAQRCPPLPAKETLQI